MNLNGQKIFLRFEKMIEDIEEIFAVQKERSFVLLLSSIKKTSPSINTIFNLFAEKLRRKIQGKTRSVQNFQD